MKILNKNLLKIIIISLICGLILTHYLEYYQTNLLKPIRNYIYFGSTTTENEGLIPESNYKFLDESVNNPVHIALVVRNDALRLLSTPDTNELTTSERQDIIKIANYFKNNGEEKKYGDVDFVVWPYNFEYPTYNLQAPWYSGMAQGYIIEVLLAAYEINNDNSYLKLAILGGNALKVPIESGGVANWLGSNAVWFEEYASQSNSEHPFVLNGHNFALEGLYWLTQYDNTFKDLYDSGLNGLIQMLPKFDKKVWSAYDLQGGMANPKYHRIHIKQLREFSHMHNNETFKYYASKFYIQLLVPVGVFYRIIFHPHNSLLIITILNVVTVFVASGLIQYFLRKRSFKREVF